jgi:hypothetical protein
MAILKKNKRSQGRVTPPSKKKAVTNLKKSVTKPKKPVVKSKKPVVKTKKPVVKTKIASARLAQASPKSVVVKPALSAAVVQTTRVTLRKDVIPLASKPSAQACPLVLDGIIHEEDFSPRDCFSCDEFDCRFYAAEERSGPLGSRLFAGGEDEEEGDEWGLPDEAGEDPGEAEDWGDTDNE